MRHFSTPTLRKLWESIRYSYWFVPSVMALAALGLAFGLLHLDRVGEGGLVSQLGWVYTGGPAGAREVLSVIAGSMVTVAGVVFSITMVALTLASSQFGPRVLRNFMEDRGSQVVLGTFIATFVYTLIVLRTIYSDDDAFVPQLSVTVGVAMALGSLGVFIYFIHHVAGSIQASQIVATIGKQLYASIDRLFPEERKMGDPEHQPSSPDSFEGAPQLVTAGTTGYLQEIDHDRLVEIAQEAEVVLRLLRRPGDFISPYKPLLYCWPASRCGADLSDRLRNAFTAGKERSHTQDVLFAVHQLTEVAVRSLSPGINDPFTAIRCLDWLGAGLARCLVRQSPPSRRKDADGHVRLLLDPVTFEEVVDAGFQQIQEYGRRSAAVTIHLLEVICDVARHTQAEAERTILLRHARQVLRGSRSELSQEQDQKDVEEQYQNVLRALGVKDDQSSGDKA